MHKVITLQLWNLQEAMGTPSVSLEMHAPQLGQTQDREEVDDTINNGIIKFVYIYLCYLSFLFFEL